MAGRTRSRTSGGDTPENHTNVVPQENLRGENNSHSENASVRDEQANIIHDLPNQSDDMEIERPFIFAKKYSDDKVLLEMDPLQHYEISDIPDLFKDQMLLVYNECDSLLRQLSDERGKLINRAAKQAVDSVMDNDTVKGLDKKPYTDLINFILERNMTVKKEHFLYKFYTFHTVRVGAMDSDNLVDKVRFLNEIDFTICQRLNQIKDFTDRFEDCHTLKSLYNCSQTNMTYSKSKGMSS